jgi:hydroxymethylglutaryl-CoA reductase
MGYLRISGTFQLCRSAFSSLLLSLLSCRLRSATLVAKYKPAPSSNLHTGSDAAQWQAQNASDSLADTDHGRRLFSVDFHGENTIIVIRVGVKSATGANVLPTYCSEACAWVGDARCFGEALPDVCG